MISYVLTFAEGILTFISPCILSMLPVYCYVRYLAGARTGADNAPPSRKNRLIVNSLGFAAGFTIVFVTPWRGSRDNGNTAAEEQVG